MNPQEDVVLPLEECPKTPPEEQLVILCEDLAAILRPIIDRQKAEVALQADAWNLGRTQPCGIFERVEAETGINPRVIYRILNNETCTVSLDLADKVCLAFGLNISQALPDEAFYPAAEIRQAVKMQGELVRTIARCHGMHVPAPTGRRTDRIPTSTIPNARKRLLSKAA